MNNEEKSEVYIKQRKADKIDLISTKTTMKKSQKTNIQNSKTVLGFDENVHKQDLGEEGRKGKKIIFRS